MIREILKDPFLTRQPRRYMTETGRAQQMRAAIHASFSGALDGLAMLALIPLAATLVTGEPQLGLGPFRMADRAGHHVRPRRRAPLPFQPTRLPIHAEFHGA